MGKFLRAGRVVILLNGRQAGHKAVIAKVSENGTKSHPYGHCLVVGIEKHPQSVTKKMSMKKQDKRSRVKTFVKYVNFNHLIATRYTLPHDIDGKSLVSDEQMQTVDGRKQAKLGFSKLMKEKFQKPSLEKSGNKPSKDLVFLRRKLRF
ncbi:60S ribosomal protein L27 [Perkinsus olseni]|uniref:60S ribosomal protein L27 n=3 Tax=Perkinsus olseni TaxID=32597 RepID=A0A7J6Q794_PEROL|nr:60S ribosomal protein L27 [Perkinsus olseni]